MAGAVKLEIRPLEPTDDVTSFACGDGDIDGFLKEDAARLHQQGVVTVYLGFQDARLAGYVALLADCINVNSHERRKLMLEHRDHPTIPAVKVARIGTCTDLQGKGIGVALLRVAADKALVISEEVGCRLLTLDAYPSRVEYYEKRGFVRNKAGSQGCGKSLAMP